MRIFIIILFLTCQFLATAQTLTTTSISGGGGDGDNCVVTDTRTNLINLRNTNGLIVGCHYVLTDHVQGRLVAGTTQKEFEKALMEADKKYQKEIEKIEKEQQKIIDKNIEFKKIDIVEPKTKKK